MRSPFKFLDYFEKKDRASFFGREAEKERLYKLVSHHRLSLIYGPSGTGKTSLIRCGLANRLKVTAWLPIFVKRQQNINESLISVLKSRLREKQAVLADSSDPVELLEALNIQYLRPPYLIFDQLEELYIDGSQEERAEFTELIKTIIDAGLSCRIIFVLREEYLGRLYEFEQLVPIYYEQRLRVEPLTAPVVKEEVIQKSFALFNISLAEPGLADRMLENLSGLKQVIPLPYLQVYLDRLWQAAYREQIRNGTHEKPALTITPAIVDQLGTLEIVFADYLRDQQLAIQQALATRFPVCPENFVRNLLDGLVTPEGTKRNVGIERQGTDFKVQEPVPTGWGEVDSLLLNEGLQALASARLLRVEEESVELAHDSLAAVIDGQRSAAERELNEYRKQIQSSYKHFDKSGAYLAKEMIPFYEKHLVALVLPEGERGHVLASKEYWRKIDDKELAAEREKRKRLRVFFLVAGVLIVLAVGTAFVLFGEWKKATLFEHTLASNYDELIEQGEKEFAEWNLQNALTYWANARFLKPGNEEAQELVDLATLTIEAERLVHDGYWDESEKMFLKIYQSDIGVESSIATEYMDAISTSRINWPAMVKTLNLEVIDTLVLDGNLISIPIDAPINRNLRALEITENGLISRTNSINRFAALTTLELNRNLVLTDIKPLEKLTALTTLELSGNHRLVDLKPLKKLTALTTLELNGNRNLTDLKPLEKLTALTTLGLSGNQSLTDLKPLEKLTALTTLELSGNQFLANIKPLEKLIALTTLGLSGNQSLTDLKPLEKLTALTTLKLFNNRNLVDIKPLKKLTALTTLELSLNENLANIKPLEKLTALTTLKLFNKENLVKQLKALTTLELNGNRRLLDIKPLEKLTALTTLELSWNNLADIKPLEKLTALTTLELSGNNLADIKPLEKLTALTTLELSGNNLADIKPLEKLTALTTLELSWNNLADIKPLEKLTALTTLKLSGNNLADIKPLEKLTALTTLELSENNLAGIKPLEKMKSLIYLDIRHNQLTNQQIEDLKQSLPSLDINR